MKNQHGQPVSGLTVSDFDLTDNGKPQKITYFSEQKSPEPPPKVQPAQPASPQTAPPPIRSIVLFFDDHHTQDFALQKGKVAAKKRLSEAARPGDRFAIFTTSGAPQADFTADPQSLLPVLSVEAPSATGRSRFEPLSHHDPLPDPRHRSLS